MSIFKKASPGQGFFKESKYGPPGSGKTFTTLLQAEGLALRDGKRIAYVDTERGTDFYAMHVKQRAVHPEPFDFDAVYTTSLYDVTSAVKSLDSKTYNVVVIDSITHLWEAAIAAYEGKRTSLDGIPMHAWGPIKKPYKALIRWLIDCPFHVFILGRQKNLFEDDPEDGKTKKVGVGMRAEGETEYEPHLCSRMESRKDRKDQSRSTIYAIYEKDRTGILAGKTYPNPNFKTIEPILPLLNGHQAQSMDPDEVAERDSELLEQDKKKKQYKANKSADYMAEADCMINEAKTLGDLATVAAHIKKVKRHMIEDHTASLRLLYERKHEHLSSQVAPSEF